MTDKQAIKKFLLGTAVKITAILSVDIPSSITITVDDPSETEKVSSINMTRSTAKVYSYIYQSSSSDDEGDYVITISVVSGGYTTVMQDKFTLVEQE